MEVLKGGVVVAGGARVVRGGGAIKVGSSVYSPYGFFASGLAVCRAEFRASSVKEEKSVKVWRKLCSKARADQSVNVGSRSSEWYDERLSAWAEEGVLSGPSAELARLIKACRRRSLPSGLGRTSGESGLPFSYTVPQYLREKLHAFSDGNKARGIRALVELEAERRGEKIPVSL